MIFLIAGTEDGRKLAGFLIDNGLEVMASVVSSYGKELLAEYKGLKINDKPLDENELISLIAGENIEFLVDASHPYAANVSQNAMNACHRTNTPYVRYERAVIPITYDRVYHVDSYELAAVKASECGKNIFLTTGSRNLKIFVDSPALKDYNLIARVLPSADILAECERLGLSPKNIIAMQGPFSRELNVELFRQYKADVVVTKNSGQIGGADTKLLAAEDLNIPVIMIDRPQLHYDNTALSFEDVLKFIRHEV